VIAGMMPRATPPWKFLAWAADPSRSRTLTGTLYQKSAILSKRPGLRLHSPSTMAFRPPIITLAGGTTTPWEHPLRPHLHSFWTVCARAKRLPPLNALLHLPPDRGCSSQRPPTRPQPLVLRTPRNLFLTSWRNPGHSNGTRRHREQDRSPCSVVRDPPACPSPGNAQPLEAGRARSRGDETEAHCIS
jgi:hypothetical protein